MLVLDESLTERRETQVLFKEARQRRRRLRAFRAVVALAVVSLAVALGFGFQLLPSPGASSHPAGSRQPSIFRGHTGATLVYALNNLRVINADTGVSRTLPLPAPVGGSSDLDMVRIGRSFILNRGNTAWLYGPDLHGPPTDLGPSLRVIPGPTDNEVWIWSDPCAQSVRCTSDDNGLQQGEVRLVDLSGRQIGPAVALPVSVGPGETPRDSWVPTGQLVNAGLVLENVYGGSDSEEIWNPTSNIVLRVVHGVVGVIAAGGNLMATATGRVCLPHCTIHLTNLQTGTERTIAMPTGIAIAGGGAISPDGAMLALSVGIGGLQQYGHPTAVMVVNLRRGTARILPGTQKDVQPNYGAANVTWSSNGWLFAAAIGSTRVLVWRPGDQSAMVLPKTKLPGLDLGIPPAMRSQLPTLIAS
jgi:hypothetical protein